MRRTATLEVRRYGSGGENWSTEAIDGRTEANLGIELSLSDVEMRRRGSDDGRRLWAMWALAGRR